MGTTIKELVRRGHDLASELKADCGAVDVRSAAALLSELATALDVQTARSDALAAKLNDVCAENAALKKFIREKCFVVPDGASCFAEADECAEKKMPETPATDAWVNEQRAHDLNAFIQHYSEKLDVHIRNGGEQFDSKSNELRNLIVSARLFREQLRGSQV